MIGKVLDNRYELLELIGKGGMAVVYRALDRRTGRSVAVKILRPEYNQDEEFSSRFKREAEAASKMSHSNIVNLLDVGQDDNIRYLVMEYVRGRTLKEVIQKKGALSPSVSAQIAIRILAALQHAHRNGIIHRDIKPQNILVHADGHIKVADFGIARVAGTNTISKSDSVMGSVFYFSPEQAKGTDVTVASDLYSVGVVMYEMLSGQIPFDGETPVAVAMQHVSAKARPIHDINPAVPAALERVVEKAMEKRPENRYQSALEMAQDIQRAMQEPEDGRLSGTGEMAKPIPSLAQTAPHPPVGSSRRLIARVCLAVLVASVIGGLIFGGYVIYDQVFNTAEAPYCLDLTEQYAQRLIVQAGLTADITRTSDPSAPVGQVISQSPPYGVSMRKGEAMRLVISTGPDEKEVPGIVGMGVEEARTELERLGFTLLALPDREMNSAPWDTVLDQQPEEGDMLPSGSVVQVRLSGGCVTLPDLAGMTRQEALLLIQQLQLNLIEIREYQVEDETLAGKVFTQQYTNASFAEFDVGDQAMQQTQVILGVYVSAQESPEATEEPAMDPEEAAQ